MNRNNHKLHYITISADESGQRIDNFLRVYLKGIPKGMIYRILRKGEIRVNQKKVKPKYKLYDNDELRIPPVRCSNTKRVPISAALNKIAVLNDAILYEDKYLLILNKPSGTAVHGGSGISFGIIEGLRVLRPNENFLELVHRLDRGTSGVLIVAKKRAVLRTLHEQLFTRQIKKDYLALVRGYWPSHIKKITAPLLKTITTNGGHVVQVKNYGKSSETHFKVQERFALATLVKASPITGRTHQIRVHTQYAGHPIAFDDHYGDGDFDHKLKACGLNRLFLHAIAITFNHPGNGEILKIEAPLDMLLHQCLLYLRNH